MTDTSTPDQMHDQSHAHDFDVLLGSWRVVNRRRKGDYSVPQATGGATDEWDEFSGHDRFETQLDGRALVEHWEANLPSGERALGFSVKVFDTTTQRWSIVWLDNRNPPDFRPLMGAFEQGVGTFYQIIEAANGRPLHVRFIWDHLTAMTARWQQAFSFDEGATWETNWVMEFTRQP
jgi:hypothetical protein